ncbi:MAG: hypothetical protein GKR98_05670 [Boseongicola sp.]|nr:MAG: hypothetical protein GKR98_05670 [Boseongicola sp.]
MFFRDLIVKKNVTLHVTPAEVRLPVRMGHRDAKKVFGEPLSRQMVATSLGGVTSVRAHESAPGDICGVTLYLGLRDASQAGLKTVAEYLEHLHAPLGSSIRLSDGGQPMVFGATEGLELSVPTALAPDADHRRVVASACSKAIDGVCVNRGWAQRADRTIFYFYGDSFQRMKTGLAVMLQGDPGLSVATARRLA